MATNYTTKTASLKATLADVRKVEATKVMVSPDGKSSTPKVDVLELIGDAKDELTEAITEVSGKVDNMKMGIDIGTAKDPIDNGVDEGSTNAWTDVSKMNFKGNVTVLKDPVTGVLNFYFAKLRESYGVSSASDLDGSSRYVYTGTGYNLPSGKSDGSTYAKVGTASTQTININGGNLVTLDSLETKVKVVITKNGEDYILETDAINGSRATVTKADDTNGVTITVSEIKKYVEADLSDGFLPDTIDCKVKVTIDETKFIAAGGTYKAKVTVNGVEKATSERFVYTTAADSTFKVGSVSATYTPSTTTHQVSGVTYYDAGGTVDIEVTGVEGTCQMSTADLNKFKVSDNSGQFDCNVTCTPSTSGVT
jgi:hypothetical protein